MKFLIGSSYFSRGANGEKFREEFAAIWASRMKATVPEPSRIVIVSEGGSQVNHDTALERHGMDVVNLTGNLGHIGQHLNGSVRHEFTGWSASMLACAMIAYTDESDFIYVEEDCLCFGPWVQQMYTDLGDGSMIFGRKHQSEPWMPCSQSLFLVRHAFLPKFVATYLAMGRDGKIGNLGEDKFVKIEELYGPDIVKRFSFGYDRERPIGWEDPVFYFQQPKQEDIDEARRRGLIP
jgi:hypothetical protein